MEKYIKLDRSPLPSTKYFTRMLHLWWTA